MDCRPRCRSLVEPHQGPSGPRSKTSGQAHPWGFADGVREHSRHRPHGRRTAHIVRFFDSRGGGV